MPWTRRQVRKLLSRGSPLTEAQQEKMKGELHADPALGHARKGSAALKKLASRAARKGSAALKKK
jgi:hypothetical protein